MAQGRDRIVGPGWRGAGAAKMALRHDTSYSLPDAEPAPPGGGGIGVILVLLLLIEVVLVVLSVPSFNGPLRNLFFSSSRPALDPSALVWTNKGTGEYFCPDSTRYGVGAGSYMKQGEALTAGYQPEFGNYCTVENEARAKRPNPGARGAGKENHGSTPAGRDPLGPETTAR